MSEVMQRSEQMHWQLFILEENYANKIINGKGTALANIPFDFYFWTSKVQN